jgi:hypothetical protein
VKGRGGAVGGWRLAVSESASQRVSESAPAAQRHRVAFMAIEQDVSEFKRHFVFLFLPPLGGNLFIPQ